jgi:hypothetical protein
MAKTVAAQIRQVLREDLRKSPNVLFTNKYKNFRTVKCYQPAPNTVSEHRMSVALGKIERIYAEAGIPYKASFNAAKNKWSSPSIIFYLPL